MAASDFLEAAVLNAVLNSIPYAEPASTYVALFTTPGPDDTGGLGNEVSDGGGVAYARVIVTADWTVTAVAGTASNASTITFPQAGAGGWGTITHVGIFDALTVGNLLYHGALTAPIAVAATEVFQFGVGALVVTMS